MGVPEGTPVLIGHILLEDFDPCLDMKKGLIYNPAHHRGCVRTHKPKSVSLKHRRLA